MASPVDSFTISVRCSGPGGSVNPRLSKTKYNIAALTAGNFTAQNTAADLLESKYEALTAGVVAFQSIAVDKFINAGYPASSANRSAKWIVTAKNTNGKAFTHTIPAAEVSGLTLPDNITADLTATAWADYKSAFEAVAVDPAALALTLTGAILGGRRA